MLARLSPARQGALIYIVASLVFIATDSLAKVMVADGPVIPVVFGRNLAYMAAVLLLLGGRAPHRLLRTARPWTQAARGLLMFGSMATWFWALSVLPMAEASTLSSTAPLITVALAGPLLGERVTRNAAVGAAIGFAGVLLLLGLDPDHLDVAMIVPLANAAILALFFLITRSLREEPAAVTMFWSGIIPLGASTLVFAAVSSEQGPTSTEWAGIGVVGILALIGHRLLVAAYGRARASDLAPMGYLGVLWAFVIGSLVFAEPASVQSMVGALAIAVGGIVALRAGKGTGEAGQVAGEYVVPVVDADEAGMSAEAGSAVPPSLRT